ncbi:hypothetical protein RvY_13238 [Ramazzottius varieornatus]|uniref:Uncharacterized protein n=1 Tax=Ramazzottius varieornatus TaxID=947166 RepID=A0A1D1VM89_RAMVA|nr:hypothetical protein RvY_13238 [Ramazzottius varieornatus]
MIAAEAESSVQRDDFDGLHCHSIVTRFLIGSWPEPQCLLDAANNKPRKPHGAKLPSLEASSYSAVLTASLTTHLRTANTRISP